MNRKWIDWNVLVFLYNDADPEERADLVKAYRLGFGHSYIDAAPIAGVQWNITPGTQLAMRVPVQYVPSPIEAMKFALFVNDIPNAWNGEESTFSSYEENGISYIEMSVHPD